MCTAASFTNQEHYFGRTFDWDVSYGEQMIMTPRNFPLPFRKKETLTHHYALLGIAVAAGGYPLYYDAINEKGLGMAGLNFPQNADYKEYEEGKDNITPFEFIPWILGQCADMEEVKELLARINLVKINFSEQFPLSPLHWIISDGAVSLTVECVKEGVRVYDNPVGVLTNNPPFDMQMCYLSHFMHLSPKDPKNFFAEGVELKTYSRGMGSMGLPGDWSSASRFVRVAFAKLNAVAGASEEANVSQFFHILGTVEQKRGCVELEPGVYEISIYTSCCNLDRGVYYYKTYDNHCVSCVDMHREDPEGSELILFALNRSLHILTQNG